MARNKVTVIGAGNVGATTAQRIAEAGLADVVLVDIVEGLPQGKALDLAEAAPVVGHDARVTGTNDYADTAGSDIVVITSGLARKPGMSRDDLLAKNAGHRPRRRRAGGGSTRRTRSSIVVTNPLDAMCHVALQASRLPARARHRHGRRARLGALPHVHRRRSWACRSRTRTRSCSAATATRWCRCRATRRSAGMPITELLSAERIEALVRAHAPTAAPRSSPCSRPARAYYAPGRVAFEMVERSCTTGSASCPARSCSQGEYGVDGLFVGVPVKLGADGIEQIIEIELTADERAAFDASADAVRELVEVLAS